MLFAIVVLGGAAAVLLGSTAAMILTGRLQDARTSAQALVRGSEAVTDRIDFVRCAAPRDYAAADLPADVSVARVDVWDGAAFLAPAGLAGPVDGAATQITVDDATDLPATTLPFRIRVVGATQDSPAEEMTVTARAGTVLTVTRAGSPASHAAGADVVACRTAALQRLTLQKLTDGQMQTAVMVKRGQLTSVSVAADPISVTVGEVTRATASLSGLLGTATGTVTFDLHDDPACSGTAVYTSADRPVSAGAATTDYTTAEPGVRYWQAAYSGDANNPAVTSTCGASGSALRVLAEPALAVTAVPGSVTLPGPAGATATVSGGPAPGGTVTFSLYDNAACAEPAIFTSADRPVASGSATSADHTTTSAGARYWRAFYSGDAGIASGTSICTAPGSVVQVLDSPAVSALAAPATADAGDPVHATASLTGGTSPTGTVTFRLFDDATCAGAAVFTSADRPFAGGVATSAEHTPTAVGLRYWQAAYSGDAQNTADVSECGAPGSTVDVQTAAPAVSVAAEPSSVTLGAPAHAVATLTGGASPGGTVTFRLFDDATCSGPPVFNSAGRPVSAGVAASENYTSAAPGTRYWQAEYGGDADNDPAISGCGAGGSSLHVLAAPTFSAVTAFPDTAAVPSPGTDLQATATLGGFVGAPDGTVSFELFGPGDPCTGTPVFTSSGHALVSGGATSGKYHLEAPAAAGTYSWRAHYSGDADNAATSSACGAATVTAT